MIPVLNVAYLYHKAFETYVHLDICVLLCQMEPSMYTTKYMSRHYVGHSCCMGWFSGEKPVAETPLSLMSSIVVHLIAIEPYKTETSLSVIASVRLAARAEPDL